LTFRNGSRAGMGYLSREARGRWPTNVLLDDATAEVLDRQADNVARYFSNPEREARFLYCPKAHRKEKDAGLEDFEPRPTASMQGNLVDGQRLAGNGTPIRTPHGRNTHKTVKPVALMEWLCRLTETPSGGRVLDPFMGSGTTGIACVRTGRQFVGIEQSGEYVAIAWARIRHAEREANATRQLTLMGGQAAG